MTAPLDSLARRYGIALAYENVMGARVTASDDAKRAVLQAMGVDAGSPAAIAASLEDAPPRPDTALRAPPGVRCFVPDWLEEGRCWGIALQLYQLRSERNWGIGDFADLAEAARAAGASGADFLGTNPLHALLLAAPEHASPFSPSNRRFLNPLYIAPDLVPGFDASVVDRRALATARSGELIDYAAVAEVKVKALRLLWQRWRDSGGGKGAYGRAAFEAFRKHGGQPLERHALFEALSGEMAERGQGAGWRGWTPEYRSPEQEAVRKFAKNHRAEVDFHLWLQWLADVQLRDAAAAARDAGMRIGLYLDFAVGEAADGSATWSDSALTVPSIRIGAPPDAFSEGGQDWGLAPQSPAELRARKVAPFRDMIASVLRHAGALRIDHAMGLYQMFVIPEGLAAKEGLYLRYPLRESLEALAELSHEYRAIVIGEDLGTVPRGFRRMMSACEIQSYRLLYFEREGTRLKHPRRYPRKALACLSSHDLPTLAGWWSGDDIALRRKFGQIGAETARAHTDQRATERKGLLASLRRAGLLQPGDDTPGPPEELDTPLAAAIHAHVAAAPSRLFAVRLEDLAGEGEAVNIPGTVDEHPNWRRRLTPDLEALFASERCRAITEAVARVRGR